MTMPGLNLIPAHRVEARRQRVVRQRCAAACAGYAALAAAAGAAPHLLFARDAVDAGLPDRLAAATGDVSRASGELARARAELGSVESLLRSSRAIAEQPDWSALPALLSAKAGNDVFLKECAVRPKDPLPVAAAKPLLPTARGAAAKPPPPPRDPTVVVGLSGFGESQASVSQFALRLETTGLFDRVRLLETSRETAVGLPLVAFRIECTLAEPGRPSAPGGRQVAGGEP